MIFNDDLMTGGSSASGAGRVNEDSMIGILTELDIVDIAEVFSPDARVQNWIEGWIVRGPHFGSNFEVKADRDRAMM